MIKIHSQKPIVRRSIPQSDWLTYDFQCPDLYRVLMMFLGLSSSNDNMRPEVISYLDLLRIRLNIYKRELQSND